MTTPAALHGWRRGRLHERPDLLADLYESVLAPERVPDVLRRIDQALDCDGAHLIGVNPTTGAPLVSLMTTNVLQAGEHAYLERYAALDPRLELGHLKPTGVGLACHDFFDDDFVGQSEFYQDFLMPLGPRYIMGGNVLREPDRNVFLVFNHFRGRPRFEGDKRAALADWMPHLARWANQLARAEGLRQAAALGERAVETLEEGLVFFDGQGRLLHANRSAVRLLGDRLRRPHLGQLGASPWASSLEPLIREVARNRQAMRFHMDGVQRAGLKVGILPLAQNRLPASMAAATGLGALASPSALGGLPLGADVVVTLDAAAPAALTVADFARRWKLTPAELRLLEGLMTGMTVVNYAAGSRVSVGTARTHVRALLQKSGFQRISQLVAAMR